MLDMRALVRAALDADAAPERLRIMAHLKARGTRSKVSIRRDLDYDRETLTAHINRLRELGYVEKVPPLPGAYWPGWRLTRLGAVYLHASRHGRAWR